MKCVRFHPKRVDTFHRIGHMPSLRVLEYSQPYAFVMINIGFETFRHLPQGTVVTCARRESAPWRHPSCPHWGHSCRARILEIIGQ